MMNQVNIGNQNTQQVGQNPVNQPVFIPEKPKINYWMVSTLLLLVILLAGGAWFTFQTVYPTTTTMQPTLTNQFTNIIPTLSSQLPPQPDNRVELEPFSFQDEENGFRIDIPQADLANMVWVTHGSGSTKFALGEDKGYITIISFGEVKETTVEQWFDTKFSREGKSSDYPFTFENNIPKKLSKKRVFETRSGFQVLEAISDVYDTYGDLHIKFQDYYYFFLSDKKLVNNQNKLNIVVGNISQSGEAIEIEDRTKKVSVFLNKVVESLNWPAMP